MSRIRPISEPAADPRGAALLRQAARRLGGTSAMVRGMAQSPAALEGFINFGAALEQGSFSARTRVLIALAVSEIHACRYCLAVYTELGRRQGLAEAEMLDARQGVAGDARLRAMFSLVQGIVIQRGEVGAQDFYAARDAGLSAAELTELVANIALVLFANYFNRLAETEVDFRAVDMGPGFGGRASCHPLPILI